MTNVDINSENAVANGVEVLEPKSKYRRRDAEGVLLQQ